MKPLIVGFCALSFLGGQLSHGYAGPGGSGGGGDDDVSEFLHKAHQIQQWSEKNPQLADIDSRSMEYVIKNMEASLDPYLSAGVKPLIQFKDSALSCGDKEACFDRDAKTIQVYRPDWVQKDEAHKYALTATEFNGLIGGGRYIKGMVILDHWAEIANEKVDYDAILSDFDHNRRLRTGEATVTYSESGANTEPRPLRLVPNNGYAIDGGVHYPRYESRLHYSCEGTARFELGQVKFDGGKIDVVVNEYQSSGEFLGAGLGVYSYVRYHYDPPTTESRFWGWLGPLFGIGAGPYTPPLKGSEAIAYWLGPAAASPNQLSIRSWSRVPNNLRPIAQLPENIALAGPGNYNFSTYDEFGNSRHLHCHIEIQTEPVKR